MKKIQVSSEFLKWFALFTMTIDHIDCIYAKMDWLHDTIGRTAFPIFSFLLLSNYIIYHPVKKYLIRLGSFAFLTQVLFYLFHFESKNILLSFFYALIFIAFTEKISKKFKSLYVQIYCVVLLLVIMFPLILMADYALSGFLFLLALYAYLREKTITNCFAVLLMGIIVNSYNIFSSLVTLLILLILLFGIQIVKKRRLMKWWFFYVYYPLHKLGLYLLYHLI